MSAGFEHLWETLFFFPKKKAFPTTAIFIILTLFLLLSAHSHQCLFGAGRNACLLFQGRGLRKGSLHLQSPAACPPSQGPAESLRARSALTARLPAPSSLGLSFPTHNLLPALGLGAIRLLAWTMKFLVGSLTPRSAHAGPQENPCHQDTPHPLGTPGLTHGPGLWHPTSWPCNGNSAGCSARPRGGSEKGD